MLLLLLQPSLVPLDHVPPVLGLGCLLLIAAFARAGTGTAWAEIYGTAEILPRRLWLSLPILRRLARLRLSDPRSAELALELPAPLAFPTLLLKGGRRLGLVARLGVHGVLQAAIGEPH